MFAYIRSNIRLILLLGSRVRARALVSFVLFGDSFYLSQLKGGLYRNSNTLSYTLGEIIFSFFKRDRITLLYRAIQLSSIKLTIELHSSRATKKLS